MLLGVVALQAGDEFTSELARIHDTIEAEGGPRQPVCLAINRSDYMLHDPQDGVTHPHLLQVSRRDRRKAPHRTRSYCSSRYGTRKDGERGGLSPLSILVFSPPS